MPEGYAFDRGAFYKTDEGITGKYADVYFTGKAGRMISLQERLADEETAIQMSTDGEIERTHVGGADAVFFGDHSLNWEANGVMYLLSARGLGKEELLKIAESIR